MPTTRSGLVVGKFQKSTMTRGAKKSIRAGMGVVNVGQARTFMNMRGAPASKVYDTMDSLLKDEKFVKMETTRTDKFAGHKLTNPTMLAHPVDVINTFKPQIFSLLQAELTKSRGPIYAFTTANITCRKLIDGTVEDSSCSVAKMRVLNTSASQQAYVDHLAKTLTTNMENMENSGSGYVLEATRALTIKTVAAIKIGGAYVVLPKALAGKKALINVKNKDEMCFKYAVLGHYAGKDSKNMDRVSSYKELEGKMDFSMLSFPVNVEDESALLEFERVNQHGVVVYEWDEEAGKCHIKRYSGKPPEGQGWDGGNTYRYTSQLLLYKEHYMYIKNYNRLASHSGSHYTVCDKCLHKVRKDLMDEHMKVCNPNCAPEPVIKMPDYKKEEEQEQKFTRIEAVNQHPIMITGDFEAILKEQHDKETIESDLIAIDMLEDMLVNIKPKGNDVLIEWMQKEGEKAEKEDKSWSRAIKTIKEVEHTICNANEFIDLKIHGVGPRKQAVLHQAPWEEIQQAANRSMTKQATPIKATIHKLENKLKNTNKETKTAKHSEHQAISYEFVVSIDQDSIDVPKVLKELSQK